MKVQIVYYYRKNKTSKTTSCRKNGILSKVQHFTIIEQIYQHTSSFKKIKLLRYLDLFTHTVREKGVLNWNSY